MGSDSTHVDSTIRKVFSYFLETWKHVERILYLCFPEYLFVIVPKKNFLFVHPTLVSGLVGEQFLKVRSVTQ